MKDGSRDEDNVPVILEASTVRSRSARPYIPEWVARLPSAHNPWPDDEIPF